jgi:hypothetical protein
MKATKKLLVGVLWTAALSASFVLRCAAILPTRSAGRQSAAKRSVGMNAVRSKTRRYSEIQVRPSRCATTN